VSENRKEIKNRRIFVTATNTDVGKTHITEELLKDYSLFGYRVGYFKPIETGVENGFPKDGNRILEVVKKLNNDFNLSIDDVVPYQFELPAAPFVAKGDTEIDLRVIKEKLAEIEKVSDIVIIEGAGGLLVPVEEDNLFIVDLIEAVEAKALLISPSSLGSINDTLLSINELERREISFEWTVNLYRDIDSFFEVTAPFYERYFKEYFIYQKNGVQVANRLIY